MATRFAVAALITSIAILAASAPAHAGKKRLTRYVADERCAPVKPLTEQDEPSGETVSGRLPAPPFGERWRIRFAVNTNGFVVRIFLGDDQVGSGLIRWDRSYRLDLGLEDYDIAGSPVDISGRLEGCDILDDEPLTKVTADIGGTLALADGIELLRGKLTWDADGMRLDGDARIACDTEGTLKGTATVDYRGPKDWVLHLLGSTEGPTCVMDGDFRIADATVGGSVTAKGGAVDGRITGRANVAAPDLPFGPWQADFRLLLTGTVDRIAMDFSADAESDAGYAKVTTGPDGELVITLNLKGGSTPAGDPVPSTDGGYVDPASLLPPVTISRDPCVIPQIKRGWKLSTTRRRMEKAGCTVRVKRVRSKKVPRKWRVVGLYTKKGKRYAPGRRITVRVSMGPPKKKSKRTARKRR